MTEEEDRLERLRAVQIAATTREILPEGIAIKCARILNWNGDPPSPLKIHPSRAAFARG
jgi:hypothetical protein